MIRVSQAVGVEPFSSPQFLTGQTGRDDVQGYRSISCQCTVFSINSDPERQRPGSLVGGHVDFEPENLPLAVGQTQSPGKWRWSSLQAGEKVWQQTGLDRQVVVIVTRI